MSNSIVFLDAGSVGHDVPWPDFSRLGEVIEHAYTAPEEVMERVRDANIILTNKVYLTAEYIAAATDLRYIGVLATGYNQVDGEAARQRGIPLCNVPAYSTDAVVQHVFTMVLALTSDVCALAQSVREGGWEKSLHFSYWFRPIVELSGKTMGIVGFGDIGSHVGRLAHAFGMNVIAYAPHPKPAPEYEPFAFVGLDDLFSESDIVTLHCPLTPENTHMVNASLLRKMKRTSYLINTARGPLINESDLVAALEQGVIAGAGLDVVETEPMPNSNPLRSAPNCLITPHVAWSSVEARTRLMQEVYANIRNFLDGTPTNVRN